MVVCWWWNKFLGQSVLKIIIVQKTWNMYSTLNGSMLVMEQVFRSINAQNYNCPKDMCKLVLLMRQASASVKDLGPLVKFQNWISTLIQIINLTIKVGPQGTEKVITLRQNFSYIIEWGQSNMWYIFHLWLESLARIMHDKNMGFNSTNLRNINKLGPVILCAVAKKKKKKIFILNTNSH